MTILPQYCKIEKIMYLVCEDNLKFEESGKLIQAAEELGIDVSSAPCDYHCSALGPYPYFIYGTRPFVLPWVDDDLNLMCGTEYLYDYSFLLSIFNYPIEASCDGTVANLFNHDARIFPAGQIPFICIKEYCHYFNRPMFIRPNDGNKSFTGIVLDRPTIYKGICGLLHVNPWELCVLASAKVPPKEEYRFFVKRNKEDKVEMLGCRYSPEESNSIPSFILQKAKDYSEFIFDKTTVADYFVLDLFIDEDDNVKVGEINSWNSSGYYCIDPKSILRMIFDV